MNIIAALIILFIGIAVGYLLPLPVGKLKQFYRRHTFKPTLLRPHAWDDAKVESTVDANLNKSKARHDQPPHSEV